MTGAMVKLMLVKQVTQQGFECFRQLAQRQRRQFLGADFDQQIPFPVHDGVPAVASMGKPRDARRS